MVYVALSPQPHAKCCPLPAEFDVIGTLYVSRNDTVLLYIVKPPQTSNVCGYSRVHYT